MHLREDDVVAQLKRIAGEPMRASIRIGIGDDAAVWQPSRSHRSVITSDMLVEGVHFSRETTSLEDAGWRAAAANLSDLAAMGARPVLATIALGVPNDVGGDDLAALYYGIAACARADGLSIVGGDLTRSPVLIVAVTAIGEVRASDCATRSGGRPGDVVAVTGMLGASRAGLDAARGAVTLTGALREEALAAHRRPRARVREGRWLAKSAHVRAMIDCSDGLSTDLARLCRNSGTGALIETVPAADAAHAAALQLKEEPGDYALAGGEDFELIVACERRAFAHVAARFRHRFGRELLRVGALRAAPGIFRLDENREVPVMPTGWDHFSGRGPIC